jgi:hypothetical protein
MLNSIKRLPRCHATLINLFTPYNLSQGDGENDVCHWITQ